MAHVDMKTINTNGKELLFVPVPEDANEITLTELGRLDYMTNGGMDYTMLPSGNYRFISATDTITGYQAHEIVEKSSLSEALYKDYEEKKIGYAVNIYSFDSMLRKHSITGRHAILQLIY